MPRRIRVACLQTDAGENWEVNLKAALAMVRQALRLKTRLIGLPENFCFRGQDTGLERFAREGVAEVLKEFRGLARRNRAGFLLGSMPEASAHPKKFFNTSYLIDPTGRIAAAYKKIHLFDIDLPGVRVHESKRTARGEQVVCGRVLGVKAGLSICYDLRFPELYRSLARRGAEIMTVPANFTYKTGEAHWEVLLRSRAIENQAFVIAPGQVGVHPVTGIRSFGNSMILDPWGKILARAGRQKPEVITADLDLDFLRKLRRAFPVLRHTRLKGF